MILVTKELAKKIPKLYSQEHIKDPICWMKVFAPWARYTAYILEWDKKDTFFGYVINQEKELGYFSLKELESVRGPGGLRIERDRYFKPTRLSVVKAKRP
jgi:hypothetical protein